MLNILYSSFDRKERSIYDDLEMLLQEVDNYKNNLQVAGVISETERDMISWIMKIYLGTGTFPSYQIFCQNFTEADKAFKAPPKPLIYIRPEDFRTYIFDFIDYRMNDYVVRGIDKLNKLIKVHGITEEISNEMERLKSLSNRNKAKDVSIDIDGKSNYDLLKSRPIGMPTGIKAVDSRIGGLSVGTMSVIAGFTSQFKTTWALNIAHQNSYNNGYNIAYITLETPKQDMYWNLLSCHSYMSKFSKYPFIPHDRIRTSQLTKEEDDYLFNVVEKDLKSDEVDKDGNTYPRGKIVFMDESDFNCFSFGEIQQALYKVDDKLNGRLDAVIVDYIQLCKFANDSGISYSEVSTVNAYTSFFRRMSQNFRKVYDSSGRSSVKQLIVILLSQIRRDSWRRAVNHGGVYDVTCMSDSSELEKSAHRIFTTYTTEELKERKVAQVQILKNRTGQTMQAEPAEVFVEGAASVFCDEDGMDVNSFAGNDQTSSLSAAFGSIGGFGGLGGLI